MVKGQEDNFEDELIDELEQTPIPSRPVSKAKVSSRIPPRRQQPVEEEEYEPRARQAPTKVERYKLFYQPEVLAIIDADTEEQIASGFNSQGEAQAMCKILNQGEEIRKNTYVN